MMIYLMTLALKRPVITAHLLLYPHTKSLCKTFANDKICEYFVFFLNSIDDFYLLFEIESGDEVSQKNDESEEEDNSESQQHTDLKDFLVNEEISESSVINKE
jgi:hypothetical protein